MSISMNDIKTIIVVLKKTEITLIIYGLSSNDHYELFRTEQYHKPTDFRNAISFKKSSLYHENEVSECVSSDYLKKYAHMSITLLLL